MLHRNALIDGKLYWVVTDRKFVRYRGGDLLELPWSEVVSVTRPYLDWIIIQTFKDNVKVHFPNFRNSSTLYLNVITALNDYNTQRKNIKSIICSLKL